MPGLLIIGALLSAKAGFQIYAIWHQVSRYYENKCGNELACHAADACVLLRRCPWHATVEALYVLTRVVLSPSLRFFWPLFVLTELLVS